MRASRLAALLVFLALSFAAQRADAHDGLSEQIAALTAQLTTQPTRADLYLRRGDLHRAAGNLAMARVDLDRAAALDPHLAGVNLARARLHLDAHRPGDAVAAATAALSGEPSAPSSEPEGSPLRNGSRNTQALLVRARAHAQLRQRAAAIADFTRAIAIEPVPDLVIERARLLEAEPADLEEALRGIEEGIRLIGPVVTLDLEALDIERRMHRYDAALRRLDAVTARSARKEHWFARRGALLDEAGRPEDALAAYEAALNAASALPPHLRGTTATSALIADIHAGIDRLTAAVRAARTGRSVFR